MGMGVLETSKLCPEILEQTLLSMADILYSILIPDLLLITDIVVKEISSQNAHSQGHPSTLSCPAVFPFAPPPPVSLFLALNSFQEKKSHRYKIEIRLLT